MSDTESGRGALPLPTTRLAVAALLPLGLSLASLALPGLAAPTLALDAAFVLALALDFARGPRLGRLRARARPALAFSQGIGSSLSWEVVNEGGRPLDAEFLPELPESFAWPEAALGARLSPGVPRALEFATRPEKRGKAVAVGLHVRARAPFGLLEFRRFLAAPQELRVLPDLAEGARYRGLLRQGRTWRLGVKAGRPRGEGLELEGLAPYREGDDARHIDWKASVRVGRVMAREFRADTGSQVAIALDSGRLMAAETSHGRVFDQALSSILVLAESVFATGDELSILAFAAGIKGQLGGLRTRRDLPRIGAFLSGLETDPVEADYLGAAARLLALLPKRSLVVFVTDAAETMRLRGLEKAVEVLSRRHAVVVAFFRDEDAERLAEAEAVDAEALYRKAAAIEIVAARESLATRLGRRASVAFVRPPELTGRLLETYAEAKRRKRF